MYELVQMMQPIVSVGSGDRTAVLTHGYGFSADEWNLIAPNLVAEGLCVALFDHRGHGGSLGPSWSGSLVWAMRSTWAWNDYPHKPYARSSPDRTQGRSVRGFAARRPSPS